MSEPASPLIAVITALDIVLFTVYAGYAWLIQWAADEDTRLWQAAAVVFILMGFGEILYVGYHGTNTGGMLGWFGAMQNQILLHQGLFLLGGIFFAAANHLRLTSLKEEE